MNISAAELANLLNADIEGDKDVCVSKPAKIEEGMPGTLTFLANPKYESHIYTTNASIVLVAKDFKPSQKISSTLLRVDDVYQSMAFLMRQFEVKQTHQQGASALAQVHAGASVAEDASIGSYVVIDDGASIGKGCVIYPHVYVGKNAKIGDHCTLFPGVCVYHDCELGNNVILHANAVVGCDGFGFAQDEQGRYEKVPQLGNVVIEDDVEIGSNCVIDRATMGSTVLRRGVKFDNLVHIAHNVEIGEDTAIAGQVGIAGSAKVGSGVQIGGQAGIAGHLTVANGTRIQGQAGVLKNTQENDKIQGSPAMEYVGFFKSYHVFRTLPDMARKLAKLEARLADLEAE